MFRYTLPALLLAAGCTIVEPITAARLATLSPLTADPGQIQVGLILPEGAGIQPGSARLKLAATRGDTGQEQSSSVSLQPGGAENGMQVFSIAPADQHILRDRQAAIRAWKDEAPDAVKGSLTASVAGCILGDGPSPDARVSVLIRIAHDGEFLPLIRNAPLNQALRRTGQATLPPCADQKIRRTH